MCAETCTFNQYRGETWRISIELQIKLNMKNIVQRQFANTGMIQQIISTILNISESKFLQCQSTLKGSELEIDNKCMCAHTTVCMNRYISLYCQ